MNNTYPYLLDRDRLQPMFHLLLDSAGLSDYGWPIKGGGSDNVYETDLFTIRPYDGGMRDCTCGEAAKHNPPEERWSEEPPCTEDCATRVPNFHFKPTNVKIQVYKYFLRASYANVDLTQNQWWKIIDMCLASLGSGKVLYV